MSDNAFEELSRKLRDMAKNDHNDPDYNDGLREAADQIDMITMPIEVIKPNAIDYLGMVWEFHKKYNHHMQDIVEWPPSHIIQLRDKLIEEEAEEFNDACMNGSLIEVADALADMLYVVFGAALAYGIPIDKVFTEVHRSNMTKSLDKNAFGKTIKGPEYSPPEIKEILFPGIPLSKKSPEAED